MIYFFFTFYFCFQPMCRVRSEAPNWGPRLWWCAAWSEQSHTSWGGDRWIWSNGGMIYLQGKQKYSEKTCPVPLCPPQIPHGSTRARTWASAVRGQRLTAWAMARPTVLPTQRYSRLQHWAYFFGIKLYAILSSVCRSIYLSFPIGLFYRSCFLNIINLWRAQITKFRIM
jgi:hypothetical protein